MKKHRDAFVNPEADEAALAISAGELIKGGQQEWLRTQLQGGKISQAGTLAILSAFWMNKDTRALEEILLLSNASEEEVVRERCKKTLGFFMQDASTRTKMVKKLLEICRAKDSPKELLLSTMIALGHACDLAAVEVLIPFIGSEDPALRKQAAESLKELTYQEFDVDEDAWKAWWDNYKHLSRDRIIEPELKKENERLKAECKEQQKKTVDLAIRLIDGDMQQAVKFLSWDDVSLKRRAAKEIAKDGDKVKIPDEIFKEIVAHLEQGEEDRETLVPLLRLMGKEENKQPAAQAVLLKYLKEDPRDSIKCEAARNLHGFESEVVRGTAKEILQTLIEEKDRTELKIQLLDLLASVGSQGALDLLVRFRDQPERRIWKTAVKAMGASRDGGAIEILGKVLGEEPESDVRFEATGSLKSLREICTPESGLTPKMVSALKTGLRDREDRIRNACITILGGLAPPDGLAILEEHLRTEEVSAVRKRCIWALGRIGDPAGLDVILRALPDSEQARAQGSDGNLLEGANEAVGSICGKDLNRWMQAIQSFFDGGQYFLVIKFCDSYIKESKAQGKNGEDEQTTRVASILDESWYHHYLAEEELEKALEKARSLKQRDASNLEFPQMVASVLVRMKKYNEALDEYRPLQGRIPADQKALFWRIRADMADCLLELKDADQVVNLMKDFPGGANNFPEELVKRINASVQKAKDLLAEERKKKAPPPEGTKDKSKPAGAAEKGKGPQPSDIKDPPEEAKPETVKPKEVKKGQQKKDPQQGGGKKEGALPR